MLFPCIPVCLVQYPHDTANCPTIACRVCGPPQQLLELMGDVRCGVLLQRLPEVCGILGSSVALTDHRRVLHYESIAILGNGEISFAVRVYVQSIRIVIGKPLNTWELQPAERSNVTHNSCTSMCAYSGVACIASRIGASNHATCATLFMSTISRKLNSPNA